MDITRLIEAACHEATKRTGTRPTKVYLGRAEYNSLAEWVLENLFSFAGEDTNLAAQAYSGLQVHEVAEEHHFALY